MSKNKFNSCKHNLVYNTENTVSYFPHLRYIFFSPFQRQIFHINACCAGEAGKNNIRSGVDVFHYNVVPRDAQVGDCVVYAPLRSIVE